MIVVDTGPLVAMANEQDRHHARCVEWVVRPSHVDALTLLP